MLEWILIFIWVLLPFGEGRTQTDATVEVPTRIQVQEGEHYLFDEVWVQRVFSKVIPGGSAEWKIRTIIEETVEKNLSDHRFQIRVRVKEAELLENKNLGLTNDMVKQMLEHATFLLTVSQKGVVEKIDTVRAVPNEDNPFYSFFLQALEQKYLLPDGPLQVKQDANLRKSSSQTLVGFGQLDQTIQLNFHTQTVTFDDALNRPTGVDMTYKGSISGVIEGGKSGAIQGKIFGESSLTVPGFFEKRGHHRQKMTMELYLPEGVAPMEIEVEVQRRMTEHSLISLPQP